MIFAYRELCVCCSCETAEELLYEVCTGINSSQWETVVDARAMFCHTDCSSFPSGSLWTLVLLVLAREGVTQLTTTMEMTTGKGELPVFFFFPEIPTWTLKVCNCTQLSCREAASAIFRSRRPGEGVTNKLKTAFIWQRARSEKPVFFSVLVLIPSLARVNGTMFGQVNSSIHFSRLRKAQ